MHVNFCICRFLKDLSDLGDDFMGRAFMPISVCVIVLRMYLHKIVHAHTYVRMYSKVVIFVNEADTIGYIFDC